MSDEEFAVGAAAGALLTAGAVGLAALVSDAMIKRLGNTGTGDHPAGDVNALHGTTRRVMPENGTIDKIVVYVTKACNVRVGIYQDNGQNYPGPTLYDGGVKACHPGRNVWENVGLHKNQGEPVWFGLQADIALSFSSQSGVQGATVYDTGKSEALANPFPSGAYGYPNEEICVFATYNPD